MSIIVGVLPSFILTPVPAQLKLTDSSTGITAGTVAATTSYDYGGSSSYPYTFVVSAQIGATLYNFGSYVRTSGETDAQVATGIKGLITTYGQGWSAATSSGSNGNSLLTVTAPTIIGAGANGQAFNTGDNTAQTVFSGGVGGFTSAAILYQLTDPNGNIFYQNQYWGTSGATPFTNPDIAFSDVYPSPPPFTSFQVPVDNNGNVLTGTYSINAVLWLNVGGTYTQYTLVTQTILFPSIIPSGIVFLPEIDAVAGTFFVEDVTTYPPGTTLVRSWEVIDPAGVVWTGSLPYIQTNTLYSPPGAYQVNLTVTATIPVAGGGTVVITLYGYEAFLTNSQWNLCQYKCGLKNMWSRYVQLSTTNPGQALLQLNQWSACMNIVGLIKIAVLCGDANLLPGYFESLTTIGQFTDECNCNETGVPQLIRYNVAGASGSTSTVSAGNGILVGGNGSGTNPYVVSLQPSLYNTILASYNSVVVGGTGITVTPVSSGGTTTYTVSSSVSQTSVVAGSGITVANNSGVYTVSITNPVSVVAGTGITVSNSGGAYTVNSSITQVTLTAGTGITLSGSAPNYTVNSSITQTTIANASGDSSITIGGTGSAYTVKLATNAAAVNINAGSTLINGAKVVAGSITGSSAPGTGQLAQNTVYGGPTGNIVPNTITATEMASNSIPTAAVQNGAITSPKLASGAALANIGSAGMNGATYLTLNSVGIGQLNASLALEYLIWVVPCSSVAGGAISLDDIGYNFTINSVKARVSSDLGGDGFSSNLNLSGGGSLTINFAPNAVMGATPVTGTISGTYTAGVSNLTLGVTPCDGGSVTITLSITRV
jgi:hypothetical protein